MSEAHLRERYKAACSPLKVHALVLQSLELEIVVTLDFEQVIGRVEVIFVVALEDSHVRGVTRLLFAQLVVAEVARSFRVL